MESMTSCCEACEVKSRALLCATLYDTFCLTALVICTADTVGVQRYYTARLADALTLSSEARYQGLHKSCDTVYQECGISLEWSDLVGSQKDRMPIDGRIDAVFTSLSHLGPVFLHLHHLVV